MMNPIRRQRLFLVIFIVVAASLAVGLMTYALRDNINFVLSTFGYCCR